jgi:hypothetical protein
MKYPAKGNYLLQGIFLGAYIAYANLKVQRIA